MDKQDLQLFDTEQGRIELMAKYGNSNTAFLGNNIDGEMVSVSIYSDKIIILTYQSNKWIREDYYNDLGEYESESYKGRWN